MPYNVLWPLYGIDRSDTLLNMRELFENESPITLEIGFGDGVSLATMAEVSLDKNFIGIEVHRPGVGRLLHLIEEKGLKNVRVMDDDAVQIIKSRIPDRSLGRVQLFFPDPWHKKRHNKRRIVQAEFVELIASKLVANGVFHLATDWQEYAEHMVEVMEDSSHYDSMAPASSAPYVVKPEERPTTKFENTRT